MNEKVVLVSVDGVRPEAIEACGHPFYRELRQRSAHTMQGRSMVPSVTLPCHTSIFYGVAPARHGITTNQWMPPVRPIPSVVDVIHRAGGRTAMCYTWDYLRVMAAMGNVDHTYHFAKLRTFDGEMLADRNVTRWAISFIQTYEVDFQFIYLSASDWCGHKYGWMSPEYLRAVANASECLQSVFEAMDDRYTMMAITDHGGHDRTHGTEMPEDMTIPLFFYGKHFAPEMDLGDVSLLDIAPTVTDVLGLAPDEDWDGRSLLA